MEDYRFDFFRTSLSRLPREGRLQRANRFPYPSLATLRQEVGGDRPRRPHGHGAGRARDRIASAPAVEGGEEVQPHREGHRSAAIVSGRAGGPAVDLGGTVGTGRGGHGAVADAQGARLVDGEGEALQGNSEAAGAGGRAAGGGDAERAGGGARRHG